MLVKNGKAYLVIVKQAAESVKDAQMHTETVCGVLVELKLANANLRLEKLMYGSLVRGLALP